MNRLLNIGFQCVGHWKLKNSVLILDLDSHAKSSNVLYAFVSNGVVKYIGKTTQQFKTRMQGYKKPARTQATNLKNNENITKLLSEGEAVDIFLLPDNGLLHYGNFHINLAAGLEDSLIAVISPPWNGVKNKEFKEDENKPHEKEHGQSIIFDQVIEKTYYKKGFFNVKQEFSDLFGNDREKIEIYISNYEPPIVGYINRIANNNQSPRIMGGIQLKDWFQKKIEEMDHVKIEIMSPVSISIRAKKG